MNMSQSCHHCNVLTAIAVPLSRSILRTLISSRTVFTSCCGRTRRINSLKASAWPDEKMLHEMNFEKKGTLKNDQTKYGENVENIVCLSYRCNVFFGGNNFDEQPKFSAHSSNFLISSSTPILLHFLRSLFYLIRWNMSGKLKVRAHSTECVSCRENRLQLFIFKEWQFSCDAV